MQVQVVTHLVYHQETAELPFNLKNIYIEG